MITTTSNCTASYLDNADYQKVKTDRGNIAPRIVSSVQADIDLLWFLAETQTVLIKPFDKGNFKRQPLNKGNGSFLAMPFSGHNGLYFKLDVPKLNDLLKRRALSQAWFNPSIEKSIDALALNEYVEDELETGAYLQTGVIDGVYTYQFDNDNYHHGFILEVFTVALRTYSQRGDIGQLIEVRKNSGVYKLRVVDSNCLLFKHSLLNVINSLPTQWEYKSTFKNACNAIANCLNQAKLDRA